jgi:Immunity protein 50
MNWLQLTLNPKAILGYYSIGPSLDAVTLHSLSLERDGPSAVLVLEPASFPSRPSSRWPVGSNKCQFTLRALGLATVMVEAWGVGVLGNLIISSHPAGIHIAFEGEAKFALHCQHLQIGKVTGYISSEA